jgi:uncharacterized caspase-like protein
VGVGRFKQPNLNNLQYAESDAQLAAEFFHSARGGSAEVLLLLGTQATRAAVRKALNEMLSRAGARDRVVLYFGGHVAIDNGKSGDTYLVLYDSVAEELATTGIRLRDIVDVAQSARAQDFILFLDGCYTASIVRSSDSAVQQDLTPKQTNLYVLGAAAQNQAAYESSAFGGGHGAFTYFLINGLNGAADADSNGLIDFGEAAQYVRSNVREATEYRQIPFSYEPDDRLILSDLSKPGITLLQVQASPPATGTLSGRQVREGGTRAYSPELYELRRRGPASYLAINPLVSRRAGAR